MVSKRVCTIVGDVPAGNWAAEVEEDGDNDAMAVDGMKNGDQAPDKTPEDDVHPSPPGGDVTVVHRLPSRQGKGHPTPILHPPTLRRVAVVSSSSNGKGTWGWKDGRASRVRARGNGEIEKSDTAYS